MKINILAGVLLALCSSAFAANTNHIRIPVQGIKLSAGSPGSTPPTGVSPRDPLDQEKGPRLEMDSRVDYGLVDIDSADYLFLRLKNVGDSALTVSAVTAPEEPFFLVAQSSAQFCKEGSVVQPGAQCVLRLKFSPAFAGNFSSQLSVVTDGGHKVVQLSGSGGKNLDPLVIVSGPSGVLGTYDATAQHQDMGMFQYTLKNPNSVPLTPASFQDSIGTGVYTDNTCVSVIPAKSTCSFNYRPTEVREDTLYLSFTETRNSTVIRYTFNKEYPEIEIGGKIVTGSMKKFTLQNNRSVTPVSLMNFYASSPTVGDITNRFRVSGCENSVLAPGQSCHINVEYVPLPSDPIGETMVIGIMYGARTDSAIQTLRVLQEGLWP